MEKALKSANTHWVHTLIHTHTHVITYLLADFVSINIFITQRNVKEEKRNWKAEVISFCVCVHVGTWHAQIYIQVNELLGSFTLTGTRKKKIVITDWVREELGGARGEAGRVIAGKEMINKKKFKSLISSLLFICRSFIQIEFFNQVLFAEWTERPQMKMGLNCTCSCPAVWASISGIVASSEFHHLCWTGSWFH